MKHELNGTHTHSLRRQVRPRLCVLLSMIPGSTKIPICSRRMSYLTLRSVQTYEYTHMANNAYHLNCLQRARIFAHLTVQWTEPTPQTRCVSFSFSVTIGRWWNARRMTLWIMCTCEKALLFQRSALVQDHNERGEHYSSESRKLTTQFYCLI